MKAIFDFSDLWKDYQEIGLKQKQSIEDFCAGHGVSYFEFSKWFRETHAYLEPQPCLEPQPKKGNLQLAGQKSDEKITHFVWRGGQMEEISDSEYISLFHGSKLQSAKPGDESTDFPFQPVALSITFTDGMVVSKEGLTFSSLKRLIERLEIICSR